MGMETKLAGTRRGWANPVEMKWDGDMNNGDGWDGG